MVRRKFTKNVVDTTITKETELIVWDTEIKGFGLWGLHRGRRSCFLKGRVKLDGAAKQRKCVIGRQDKTPVSKGVRSRNNDAGISLDSIIPFAALSARSGASLSVIGNLLGHTQPPTTARPAMLVSSAIRMFLVVASEPWLSMRRVVTWCSSMDWSFSLGMVALVRGSAPRINSRRGWSRCTRSLRRWLEYRRSRMQR